MPHLALAALLCLLPITAAAAGFDCTKAGTPLERAICTDRELSALDDQLGAAYRGARQRMGDTADMLVEGQRDWLRSLSSILAGKAGVVGDKSGVSYRSEEVYRMQGLTVVPVSRRIEEDTQKGNRMVRKITESTWDGTRWFSKTRYGNTE